MKGNVSLPIFSDNDLSVLFTVRDNVWQSCDSFIHHTILFGMQQGTHGAHSTQLYKLVLERIQNWKSPLGLKDCYLQIQIKATCSKYPWYQSSFQLSVKSNWHLYTFWWLVSKMFYSHRFKQQRKKTKPNIATCLLEFSLGWCCYKFWLVHSSFHVFYGWSYLLHNYSKVPIVTMLTEVKCKVASYLNNRNSQEFWDSFYSILLSSLKSKHKRIQEY